VQATYPEFSNRIDAKVDHNFNATNRIMVRYDIHDSVYSKPNFFGNIADPGCCPAMYQTLQSGVINFTRTIGGSKVLELRSGLGRVAANRVPGAPPSQEPAASIPRSSAFQRQSRRRPTG
jgi:hypothetical protein